MKFLTGYEPASERVEHSNASGFKCKGDSLTVQADARDADINVIMDRYARTGQVPPLSRLPSFGDFDGVDDFRTAIHAVREAESLFMRLPAKVRARFDNDPQLFLEASENPDMRLEFAELGLLSKEVSDAIKKAAQAPTEPSGDSTRAPVAAKPRGARAAASSGDKPE